jgi:hypothetical protein
LVFVDAGEDSIMADEPLNPPVTPVEQEELEKTSFDMNVSQWSCNKKPFERVVRTRVDPSAWGR